MEDSMYHSSFTDAHQGRRFTMRFGQYPNGVIAELEVEGLPIFKFSDKTWTDQESAKEELESKARQVIESRAG
ncbi:hypothetical protein [Pseudomonas viridiflava]|uniref:hypothetical protein n=1 Tax=Pseudomonas viridiflava TaxID=33069 RepID=UPI0013CE806A|nr:hypothetical protein [Pseudomonas viridiflava]WKW30974.1 hypothetical protein KIH13_19565 [Pseudomonas viridiflava]